MNDTQINRRRFIAGSTVASAMTMAGVGIIGSAQAILSQKLKVGVVGVGGRGSGAIRDILSCNKYSENVEVVAMGDFFDWRMEERIDSIKQACDKAKIPGFNITPGRCFSGWDAYKQVIDSGIDIVALTTPPQFRAEHLEYAVNAGKHVFCEKPVAIDPAGLRRFLRAGNLAKRKGLGILGGTQRRHQPPYLEAMKRIQAGAIGDVISAHIYWNTNDIWYRERKTGMSDAEFWMYNWYHADFLSGDHIVEQHLHQFDVACWLFGDVPPVSAYGMGGRQKHTDRGGNIYDHFAVEYEFPGGQRVSSQCRQISGTDGKIAEDVIGSKGKAWLAHHQPCEITGPNSWIWNGDYRLEYEQEHQDFLASIRIGDPINDADNLANATGMAILGRESAYTGKRITWEEMMKSELSLAPTDLQHWDGKLRPVPKPGMKRT